MNMIRCQSQQVIACKNDENLDILHACFLVGYGSSKPRFLAVYYGCDFIDFSDTAGHRDVLGAGASASGLSDMKTTLATSLRAMPTERQNQISGIHVRGDLGKKQS